MREFEWPGAATVVLAAAWALTGCGGSGSPAMLPISVSLSSPTVTVLRGGSPVQIQIAIRSTSETALVNFTGLPGGVKVAYAASDTSPSGLLTFTAAVSATAGTYTPFVTVDSAGQTATLKFTLVVSDAIPALTERGHPIDKDPPIGIPAGRRIRV